MSIQLKKKTFKEVPKLSSIGSDHFLLREHIRHMPQDSPWHISKRVSFHPLALAYLFLTVSESSSDCTFLYSGAPKKTYWAVYIFNIVANGHRKSLYGYIVVYVRKYSETVNLRLWTELNSYFIKPFPMDVALCDINLVAIIIGSHLGAHFSVTQLPRL